MKPNVEPYTEVLRISDAAIESLFADAARLVALLDSVDGEFEEPSEARSSSWAPARREARD